MIGSPSATLAEELLGVIRNKNLYLSLHNSDPLINGALTSEISGGGYVRSLVTFTAPALSSMFLDKNITFTNLPATEVTHAGLWSSATSGVLIVSIPIKRITLQGGQSLTFPERDIVVSFTPIIAPQIEVTSTELISKYQRLIVQGNTANRAAELELRATLDSLMNVDRLLIALEKCHSINVNLNQKTKELDAESQVSLMYDLEELARQVDLARSLAGLLEPVRNELLAAVQGLVQIDTA